MRALLSIWFLAVGFAAAASAQIIGQDPLPTPAPIATPAPAATQLPVSTIVAEIPEALRPARVFALNLWSAPVDIQLGDQSVFSVEGLKPGVPSTLTEFSAGQGLRLFYKPSQQAPWRHYKGSDQQAYAFNFKPGATYLIRVTSDGNVQVIAMAGVTRGKAHILLANASGQTLDEMALLPGTVQPSLRATNLPNQAFTEFSDIDSGNYASRWISQGQANFAKGDKAAIALVPLQADAWYCFLVQGTAVGSQTITLGQIWDISPIAASVP